MKHEQGSLESHLPKVHQDGSSVVFEPNYSKMKEAPKIKSTRLRTTNIYLHHVVNVSHYSTNLYIEFDNMRKKVDKHENTSSSSKLIIKAETKLTR